MKRHKSVANEAMYIAQANVNAHQVHDVSGLASRVSTMLIQISKQTKNSNCSAQIHAAHVWCEHKAKIPPMTNV